MNYLSRYTVNTIRKNGKNIHISRLELTTEKREARPDSKEKQGNTSQKSSLQNTELIEDGPKGRQIVILKADQYNK